MGEGDSRADLFGDPFGKGVGDGITAEVGVGGEDFFGGGMGGGGRGG